MKSSLRLTTSTLLNDKTMPKIKTIWKSLQSHNDSAEFRNPVDYKAMQLFDYPNYIKHPMDLSTIHRKLRESRYRLVEEVLDDFQLIWDNCKAYNPTASWIYSVADRLERAFKKMVEFYLPSIPLLPNANYQAPIKKKEEEPIEEEEEVPMQEKHKFVDKLRLLSPPNIKIVVECIKENCPDAFTEDEDGKAQMLIDLLDSRSFYIVLEKLEELVSTEKMACKKLKFI